jgi:WD40 repeat protein
MLAFTWRSLGRSAEAIVSMQQCVKQRRQVSRMVFLLAGDRVASASWDDTVQVWDAKTGQPLHTLKGFGHINTLTFSQDKSRLETKKETTIIVSSISQLADIMFKG